MRAFARDRIWNEVVTGTRIECPDGTIIEGGKIVKLGPRAIVSGDGTRVVGMRPEDDD